MAIEIAYGSKEWTDNSDQFDGLSVKEVYTKVTGLLELPGQDTLTPEIGGEAVDWTKEVSAGDSIEFKKASGEKGKKA